MPRPWLTLALAFAGGLLCRAPWPAALAALGLALGLRRRPGLALPTLAVACGLMAGGSPGRWAEAAPTAPPSPLTGEVTHVRLVGDRVAARIAPDDAPAWQVQVWLSHRPGGLAPGARVQVKGALTRLPPADNPGGFDARAHGAASRVRWRARGLVLLLQPAPPAAEQAVRARLAARARLAQLDRELGAGLLAGLLLGDRAAVPEGAVDALQATGAGHLLAVSGLHVGGLAALLFALFWRLTLRLGARRPDRWAALLALPAVPAFVSLAQAPVSAQRAGWMVGAWLLARALERRPDGLELLGMAALAVLADRPLAVGEPGFQLSFGAVAALLVVPTGGGRLRQALTVTLVAWVATAPLQAWHFGTAAPVAPVANLLLTPLAATVVVPLGLLGLALAPVTLAPLQAAAAAAEGLVAVAEVLAQPLGLQVVGAHAAPALAVPVAVGALWLAGRPRLAVWAPAVLLAWSVALWPRGTTVDFVAVGQGDAVLLRSGGQAMLVDAGPDAKARALLGYLRHEGVRRLEVAVLSHRHPDHYGGLAGLAGHLPIGVVYDHGVPDAGGPWARLAARLAVEGTPVTRPPPGWRIGALTVSVLADDPPPELAENDRSLVLRVVGPAGSVLLTGDVEGPGEARLQGRVPPTTVLKAPHHGSKTSSGPALLAEACPRAVVFTVGRHNRYGFPHARVRARYAEHGVGQWRTDAHGRVRLRLDGSAPTLQALRRPRVTLGPPHCEVQ